jgi:hypothetical protein
MVQEGARLSRIPPTSDFRRLVAAHGLHSQVKRSSSRYVTNGLLEIPRQSLTIVQSASEERPAAAPRPDKVTPTAQNSTTPPPPTLRPPRRDPRRHQPLPAHRPTTRPHPNKPFLIAEFMCLSNNQPDARLAQSVERETLNRDHISRLWVRPPRRAQFLTFLDRGFDD